uniref:Mitochondrial import receptor subunit TOM7 homolog n=1 Tax=Gadus morhua TaxID=8049 RepID=A0A8C5D3T8_GADMO
MAKLSKETKQRLQQVFQCGQFVIRWGFIPTVLYLGFQRGADPGMPEPTILRCVQNVTLRTKPVIIPLYPSLLTKTSVNNITWLNNFPVLVIQPFCLFESMSWSVWSLLNNCSALITKILLYCWTNDMDKALSASSLKGCYQVYHVYSVLSLQLSTSLLWG